MGNEGKIKRFRVTGEDKQQERTIIIKGSCERVRLEGAKGERDV